MGCNPPRLTLTGLATLCDLLIVQRQIRGTIDVIYRETPKRPDYVPAVEEHRNINRAFVHTEAGTEVWEPYDGYDTDRR